MPNVAKGTTNIGLLITNRPFFCRVNSLPIFEQS